MLEVRKTTLADLQDVMNIIHQAMRYFKDAGISQWQTGYPNADTIRMDIAQGNSYVLTDDDEVVATAAIIAGEDPNYAHITNGAWLNEDSYIVIHRIAVATGKKGLGLANLLYDYAEQMAKEKGIRSLRADTHSLNRSMRRFLKKREFKACGIVHMKDGTERIAYQKIL